ncbi:Peptidyl-tRNA hydrolase [Taphrina deformans PYCC 5710]|uniref:peptidyl-tRNA hydrolase n=1 Tax=Taphrina deformans (strain PYCC 5710 / ATCC 11124 / CBS 356.35 / IMI 108563 / JCM 9778 / NBRC 8474) TaxID=1097556 RepID=R4XBJ8_TAPDE|nr:Peptidyl-tRNA hydrolase [Taphrina deformans PYCC 5710]|eukprot:CCG80713.1 Peptidyl-tRNA hydrolase [Taphrina deformans PYCC 5710]
MLTLFAVAVALVSGTAGYYLATLQGFSTTVRLLEDSRYDETTLKNESDIDSDEEEEGPYPSSALPESSEEHKLVLVVRTDLGMGKGKMAAQCSHASLACYKRAVKIMPKTIETWESYGQAKIALKCVSEEDMLMLQATAISLGLVAEVIHDAGRTQIAAGSATVLGIGPGPKSLINTVTGHLSLL